MKSPITSWLLFLSALCSLHATTRTLTNQNGASLEAELIELKNENGQEVLTIRRTADQRKFEFELGTLTLEDQKEIRQWWKKEQAAKEVLKSTTDLEFNFKQNRKRESMYNSPYSDDETYYFTPMVEITNDDLYQTFTGNKVRIACFARHTYYKRSLKVTSIGEETVDLPRMSTIAVSGNEYSFNNYESEFSNYEYGWEYDGYIVIVKNSKGEVTHIKASDDKYERALQTVLKAKQGDYYSTDLQTKLSSYTNN